MVALLSRKLMVNNLLARKLTFITKSFIYFLCLVSLVIFIYIKPQQFINLWLTADQQGQFLFDSGEYKKSSHAFTDIQWKAYSSYGAQDYKKSARFYAQFSDKKSKLAQANALAHGREYIKARNLYQEIIHDYLSPSTQKNEQYQTSAKRAAQANIKIVQAIIDDVNRMSESQKAENGDSSKELGDEPQTGDGAETKELPAQKIKQLTAEQLLLDPKLNEMWLKQVQKDPSRFLSQKFYMQLNHQKEKLNNSSTELSTDESTDGSTY
jgi:Ca-activated chloride channel homolog